MKKFNINRTELIQQNALEALTQLESNSFDLAICDPPYGAASSNSWNYNGEKKVNGFGGGWKLNSEVWDLLSTNENFTMTFFWLKELQRIIKPSGSIWIHATYHNAGFVNVACQLLGLEIINEITWFKRNAFPNLSKRRLTASHETIFWVHTGGEKNRKYRFNYDEIKEASFEGDQIKQAGKQLRTVWDVPNNKTKDELLLGKHPTQKPLRISERLLMISGIKGGKLLVPFAGSGTEIVAGINYGMECLGYEIEDEYFDLAKSRIIKAVKENESKINFE
jgi:site-specific DNA-methyltransferase (adenine-specific)